MLYTFIMLRIKPYKQSPAHCGPVSLKMVLEYYGTRVSKKQIAKLAGTDRDGTRAQGLVKAAKHFGYTARVKDDADISDIEHCLKKKIPVIVAWFAENEGHYSVVVGLKKGKIYLQDPEVGKTRSLPLPTFKRVWFDFRGDYLKSKKDIVIRRMIVVQHRKHKSQG